MSGFDKYRQTDPRTRVADSRRHAAGSDVGVVDDGAAEVAAVAVLDESADEIVG